jgi:CHAD domain-containing protein
LAQRGGMVPGATGATSRDSPEILLPMPWARAVQKPQIAAGSRSRDQILALVREQLKVIRAEEPGTRLGTDPEELHKMRAAVRRLRAILGAVRDMFDLDWLEGLRVELDWLGTVLGGLRDLDVLREYLRKELASLKPAARVVGDDLFDLVDAQRAHAQHKIVAALDGERYTKLLARLERAVQRPKVVSTDLSLPAVAASQFKKLRKAVKALPKKPNDDDLHAVRIRVKRARYAAELAQPIVGEPAERFVARTKKLQDILGEYQDAVVAEKRLRTLVAEDRRSPVALLANELVKRQRVRRQAAQLDFFEQWPKLERRGRKTWK